MRERGASFLYWMVVEHAIESRTRILSACLGLGLMCSLQVWEPNSHWLYVPPPNLNPRCGNLIAAGFMYYCFGVCGQRLAYRLRLMLYKSILHMEVWGGMGRCLMRCQHWAGKVAGHLFITPHWRCTTATLEANNSSPATSGTLPRLAGLTSKRTAVLS